MAFIFTVKFFPLNAGLQDGTSSCCEFFRKRCSSNIAADGLSAGFLRKQHRKNSLPSVDNLSGIGGVSFITLNMAAAWIKYDKCNLNKSGTI